MSTTSLSDSVKKFIVDYIDSVGKLEVLLRLARDEQRSWSAAEISRELRSNDALAERYLNELSARKLLRSESGVYRYAPATVDLRENVSDLSNAYEIFHLRIIQLIYEKPASSIQQFADAFKIKNEEGNEDG